MLNYFKLFSTNLQHPVRMWCLIGYMLRLSEYLAILLASTIKFVGGLLAGVAFKLSWWETSIFSTLGMMITVTLVIYGGEIVAKFLARFGSKKPKRKFTKVTRIAIKVKSSLGLWGIALLTPFIFTPILGSFLALHFRFNKVEILWKMFLCGLFAGAVQTWFFYFVKSWFV